MPEHELQVAKDFSVSLTVAVAPVPFNLLFHSQMLSLALHAGKHRLSRTLLALSIKTHFSTMPSRSCSFTMPAFDIFPSVLYITITFEKYLRGWRKWLLTPLIPVLMEAEAGRSLQINYLAGKHEAWYPDSPGPMSKAKERWRQHPHPPMNAHQQCFQNISQSETTPVSILTRKWKSSRDLSPTC